MENILYENMMTNGCGDVLQTSHGAGRWSCNKCSEEKNKIIQQCYYCNNLLCGECIVENPICFLCKNNFLGPNCGCHLFDTSKKCDNNKDKIFDYKFVEQISVCISIICEHCKKRCVDCHSEYCSKCCNECVKCLDLTCINCDDKCLNCKESICNQCAFSYHSGDLFCSTKCKYSNVKNQKDNSSV